jgi:hypothetical protein
LAGSDELFKWNYYFIESHLTNFATTISEQRK